MVLSGRSERFPDAIVFDLDGTIVDTESVEFESTRLVWAAHNAEYTLGHFEHAIGTTTGPDWVSELASALDTELDHPLLHEQRQRHRLEMLSKLRPREGIVALVQGAVRAGIALGVASNSPLWWVQERLRHSNLDQYMQVMVALDTSSAPKPHPAPFLEACAALGARPAHSVAIEDSAPGVRSARAAGLFTIGCPGPLTRNHDLSAADLVVASHVEIDLLNLGHVVRR